MQEGSTKFNAMLRQMDIVLRMVIMRKRAFCSDINQARIMQAAQRLRINIGFLTFEEHHETLHGGKNV